MTAALAIAADNTAPFEKVVRLGTMQTWEGGVWASVFCKIKFTDEGRLSISGVIGPRPSGNAAGSCGQIRDDIRERAAKIRYAPGWNLAKVRRFLDVWDTWHLNDMKPYDAEMKAAGWDVLSQTPILGYKFTLTPEALSAKKAAETAAADALRAGVAFLPSPAQTAVATKPYSLQIWVREGEAEPAAPEGYQRSRSTFAHVRGDVEPPERKTLGWLKPEDHPEGLLGRSLREGGPGYGTKWWKEEVPPEALDFLRSLPDTDREPAWV